MCEHDLTALEMERLARAIYGEICKQFDSDGPAVPVLCSQAGMRDVLIEGHVDLIRVASTLAKRFCVRVPEIETIGEPGIESSATTR